MIGIYLFAAVVLLIAGAAAGILVVVSLGVHREEHGLSVTSDITDRVARGARRLNGLYAQAPGVIDQVRRYRHNT